MCPTGRRDREEMEGECKQMKRDAEPISSTARVNPERRIILGKFDLQWTHGSNEEDPCLFCCIIANNGYPCGSNAVFPATAFMALHLKSDSGVKFQM